MIFKIGITTEHCEKPRRVSARAAEVRSAAPRKSVVQVYFSGRGRSLAYYNDRFDLRKGDVVYVDGKLEGVRGRVMEVNYNFRIHLADYKRVIAVVDTEVHGQFFQMGAYLLTYDRAALPAQKAALWFWPPRKAEDVFACGRDDTYFLLEDLSSMDMDPVVLERGIDYYWSEKVRYLCLDGERGWAIVEGSRAYEVAFTYRGGEISGLTCSCFCGGSCKHEYAVMMLLKKALERIEENYPEEYRRSGYFAAVAGELLFSMAVEGREGGTITL